jgi:hypothetical protein
VSAVAGIQKMPAIDYFKLPTQNKAPYRASQSLCQIFMLEMRFAATTRTEVLIRVELPQERKITWAFYGM